MLPQMNPMRTLSRHVIGIDLFRSTKDKDNLIGNPGPLVKGDIIANTSAGLCLRDTMPTKFQVG